MPLPQLLSQYCDNTSIAISIAHNKYDHPLIYVNKKFEELTGYNGNDLYGKNCRALQNNSKNKHNRQRIRDFIYNKNINNIRVPLVNFKKDGTPFINLLFISKLKDCLENTQYLFASQFDISNTYPDILSQYEHVLETTLSEIPKTMSNNRIVLSGSLSVVANAAASIAQAKIMLDQIDASHL
ncbi:PAS domain-containing protein [Neokomagataea anthophila]|uniref:PAS domain-containing protein n=1 Tax=Neokomagataea anthophila TaxID=2826925 RepID=A0ABS5EAL0_9PROT|nr:PAS domain-containing protein [Neokomagataea anthophila]MBR0560558.1 PAS domain-containing protein [Neokomagataea anthophila]